MSIKLLTLFVTNLVCTRFVSRWQTARKNSVSHISGDEIHISRNLLMAIKGMVSTKCCQTEIVFVCFPLKRSTIFSNFRLCLSICVPLWISYQRIILLMDVVDGDGECLSLFYILYIYNVPYMYMEWKRKKNS